MDKNYINGLVIKEKTFDNGGGQLRISVKVQELIEQLQAIEENGWANILISRRKKPSDKGVTHYAYQDTWKPDGNKDNFNVADRIKEVFNEEEDLPF